MCAVPSRTTTGFLYAGATGMMLAFGEAMRQNAQLEASKIAFLAKKSLTCDASLQDTFGSCVQEVSDYIIRETARRITRLQFEATLSTIGSTAFFTAAALCGVVTVVVLVSGCCAKPQTKLKEIHVE